MDDLQKESGIHILVLRYVLDPHIVDLVLTVQIFICGTAGLFGILGNAINILVFYKQGYSVNITLTALAVSDTGALVTLQVFYLLMNPWFLKSDLGLNPSDLIMIISFYPHNYFIRVCGFITAYAALERCVCVVCPLKVKRIFTNKTAIVTVILIFAITTLDLFPLYYTIYLDWGFSPSLNKSILHIMYRQNPFMVFNISYYINDLMAPYTTFFIILMSTAIITIKLKQQARWRQSMSNVKTETHISSKERKTVVMLSTISIVFVVCLIPQSTILTAVSFVPDISYGGRYFYLALMGYCVSYLSETILSSVNILVYLRMSHKYKEQFLIIFSRKKII
ncbi:melatonin-related receptor-like [Physella acuta]|uniref:melatonin-related receptor-like n=1 Tax=Physella acuta TaxID=109671 RepID=UPI0027DB109E|nr:melatonin-related receptor-like [Physella acuta]